MKKAKVQMTDPLYQKIKGLAKKLDVTVPELLRKAAEQLVQRQVKGQPRKNGGWHFPEGRRLGPFRAPVEDWRLLANESAD